MRSVAASRTQTTILSFKILSTEASLRNKNLLTQMEDTKKSNPSSLPPNYVSLADLQQRWIKQQQLKQQNHQSPQPQQSNLFNQENTSNVEKNTNKEPQFEPKNTSQTSSNPNPISRKPYRRNDRGPKGPKECQVLKPSDPNPHASEDKMEKKGIESGDAIEIVKKIKRKTNKKKKKNKKLKEKEKAAQNEAIVEQEKENPGKNGKCEEEEKKMVSDRTVEVERKFEKLNVKGREWRRNCNGRPWAGGIERPRRVFGGYGSRETRGSWLWKRNGTTENGMVWVKKGVIGDES